MPQFLEMYLPVVRSLRFGHPLAVENAGDPPADLEFGPLISATRAADLRAQYREAMGGGGIPLYRGTLAQGRFLDGQDTSAYVAPAAAMNASNGSLVASVATDDADFGAHVAEKLPSRWGQPASKPRRPRGGVRREGCLLEGRLRRRRPAGTAVLEQVIHVPANRDVRSRSASLPRGRHR